MTFQDKKDAAARLVLRAGLAWFIFLWAAHKIITPKQYQSLARHFDGLDIALGQIIATGALQIALCILVLVGIFRPFTYGALALMHFFTLTRRWEGFLDPFAVNEKGFPVNRNQVIDLAVMAAFVALILMIPRDHWSLGAWLRRRKGPVWWH
ncbi:MAG: hypothetical protein P1U53_13180 [Sulfitobacter sp.]|nr:hypothetical protein [Sulfitobacter sp.]